MGFCSCINCFVAVWHASWPCVLFWLAKRSHFRWNFFDFPHFSKQTFFTLAFLFSFFHFLSAFGFSNSTVASMHFALCLLSFFPYFQVRPKFTPFSFLSFIVFLSFVLIFPFWVVLLSFVVDYSEIRHTSPSIAFLFTCLGALIDSSSDLLGALSHCSSD